MVGPIHAFLCIGDEISHYCKISLFAYYKKNNAFVLHRIVFFPEAHLLRLVGEVLGISRTQVLLKMLPKKAGRKILSLKKNQISKTRAT